MADMTTNMMSLFSTVILIVLIVFVYLNNRDIRKLTQSANNVSQYILKSEANDNYMFHSNTNIVKYLKSRDSMKQELELLKQQMKLNNERDIEQDKRLEKSEATDQIHNEKIQEILNNNRSDLNYLVNLSFTEVNKHLPNKSDEENLNSFRELIFSYVLLLLKDFNTILPDYDLDKFINTYGADVSFIIAESIYTYRIYNNFDDFPSILLIKDKLVAALKNAKHLDFVLKTYFPRMFSYIDSNSQTTLFPQLERLNKGSKGELFSVSKTAPFVTHIMKDIEDIKLDDIDQQLYTYMFVLLPTYFTKSLYYNSDTNAYVKELEENLIMVPLNSCFALQMFYKTWMRYNPVKAAETNLVPETDKSKTLKKLIEGNSIFKTIYLDKIVKYNDARIKMADDPICAPLPMLPEVFKEFYNTDEIKVFDAKAVK